MVSFGRVTGIAERVLIVAAGQSLRGIDLTRFSLPGVWLLLVTHVIKYCKGDAWITVDPDPTNRVFMREQVPGVEYFAAVPNDYGEGRPYNRWHVGPAETNVTYLRRVLGSGPAKSQATLSEDPGVLHSGNSAWGGLGLAYHKRASRIGFLGLDGAGGYAYAQHWPPGDLRHLPWLFETALPQLKARGIEVMVGNPASRITCFPRVTPARLLEWLQS